MALSNSSNGRELIGTTGIAPLRGSLVAPLIACDGIEILRIQQNNAVRFSEEPEELFTLGL